MAKAQLDHPVQSLKGKIGKNADIVFRQKTTREGIVFHQEAYVITNPRNRQKNPPTGEELRHLQLFRQACLLTKQQIADPVLHAQWRQRFQAQLAKPDKDAPIDPKTGKRKIYSQLPAYIRATILRQLKASPEGAK